MAKSRIIELIFLYKIMAALPSDSFHYTGQNFLRSHKAYDIVTLPDNGEVV